MRLTTIPYSDLASHLGIQNPSSIDEALANAGYVRLDLGTPPLDQVVIMSAPKGALGRDPGHRAIASITMRALLFVAHAEGPPSDERIARCISTTLDLVTTDTDGEEIVHALGAYYQKRPPELVRLPPDALEDMPSTARAVHGVARDLGVITDIAIERAYAVGPKTKRWKDSVRRQLDPVEPVRRARRHDASDYENAGLGRQLGEVLAWLRTNPNVTTEEFARRAMLVGLEPHSAAKQIEQALNDQKVTPAGGPSSTIKSSSSGLRGPAGSSEAKKLEASDGAGGTED